MVCYGIWQIYFEFSFQKWDVRCYPITAAAYYHVQGKEITMHNFFWDTLYSCINTMHSLAKISLLAEK